jgi:hypothetical protein
MRERIVHAAYLSWAPAGTDGVVSCPGCIARAVTKETVDRLAAFQARDDRVRGSIDESRVRESRLHIGRAVGKSPGGR